MNWVSINEDSLRAAAAGSVLDAAEHFQAGAAQPIAEAVENAVAFVRGAVSAGNQLDRDTSKVPKSLKAITVRVALFALMARIDFKLSEDQRETKKADMIYLTGVQKNRIQFEKPDTPAGNAEMQQTVAIRPVRTTHQQATRESLAGLM